MLLNIILSDFQQYRTLLAKVIQFFVSPEKCENQSYKFLTPKRGCILTVREYHHTLIDRQAHGWGRFRGLS